MSLQAAFVSALLSASNPRLLPSLLLVATLACGSEPADGSSERDDPSAESDDEQAPEQPARDGGARPRADAGRGAPQGELDAAPAETPGSQGARGDGASPPARDGAADSGRPTSARDGSVRDDAGADVERSDASGGGEPDAARPSDTSIPMTIPAASNGAGEIRPTTTVLKSAKNGGKDVWDFENKKIGVSSTVECEGSEGQPTVFELEDGVTVKNLIVAGGRAGGNGIVCKGSCTLDHVYWEDICEDAATNSKDGATMTLDHVIALHATDKVFQHNAKGGSKTIIRNSYVSDFGKLWRSCGDCENNGGPRHLEIDNVRVDGIKTTVAGANRNYGDTVSVKDLYVKGGYDAAKDKPKICQEYIGVTDHNGESTKVDDGKSQWGTSTCKLQKSDVKSF